MQKVIALFLCLCLLLCGCSSAPTETAPETAAPSTVAIEIPTVAATEIPTTVATEVPETETTSEITEPVATETTLETEPTTIPTTEPEPVGITYVLNTNTMKFHYERCKSAAKIKAANRSSFTGTRDEIIAKGYSPCGNCDP